MNTLVLVSCAYFLLVPEQPGGLLETVLEGHSAATDAISTFSCRISVTYSPKTRVSLPESGEYWRSRDAIRIRFRLGDRVNDTLIKDGKTTVLSLPQSESRSGLPRALIGKDASQSPLYCDAWSIASFTVPGANLTFAPLREALAKPHKIKSIKRDVDGGRDCIEVQLAIDGASELLLCFDSKVNYLISKLTLIPPSKGFANRTESHVMSFREYRPGVYFPEVVEQRFYRNDSLGATYTYRFSEVRINEPMSAGIFDLRLPKGVQLTDQFQERIYTSDESGKEIAPAKKIYSSSPPPEFIGQPQRTETKIEPSRVSNWILPASLVILGAGFTLWVVRTYRKH